MYIKFCTEYDLCKIQEGDCINFPELHNAVQFIR